MKKRISDKQRTANMKNTLKGGVKTPEGKSVVRFNARKHGILSSLVAEYEDDFFKMYLDELFNEFQPNTFIEQILVERIALHYLKLYRVTKAESEFIKSSLSTTRDFNDFDILFHGKEFLPSISHIDIENLAGIYGRYETSIENKLYRAIRELKSYRDS
ncbi:TPA: hypothetical protein I8034_002969 [Legionella pneumophila]|nr:hypothetical protein [Legionella pneumophila subsp. fraseri]HAT1773592.1 hypothetical protein [Legionella pneumophila]MDX1847813.1 hypothetical protein [Legionella pneumophila subsp. fraseri]HAT2128386.1 hypothetical protein [Legionella pneumophila]HAT2137456.1 hypothetical protein [Legionella pneumophila]